MQIYVQLIILQLFISILINIMIMSEERRKPNHARWENLMDNALIDLLVSFSDSDPYYRRDGEFSGTSWRHIIQELIKTFPESKEKFTRQKVLQHFRIVCMILFMDGWLCDSQTHFKILDFDLSINPMIKIHYYTKIITLFYCILVIRIS